MTDTLERPNADALTAADADPVAFAERLAVLPWLTERLNEWPDPLDSDGGEQIPPTVDGGKRVHPAWLASAAVAHLAQVRADWTGTLRNPEGFRLQAARWAVEKLANLPEAPDSDSGAVPVGGGGGTDAPTPPAASPARHGGTAPAKGTRTHDDDPATGRVVAGIPRPVGGGGSGRQGVRDPHAWRRGNEDAALQAGGLARRLVPRTPNAGGGRNGGRDLRGGGVHAANRG